MGVSLKSMIRTSIFNSSSSSSSKKLPYRPIPDRAAVTITVYNRQRGRSSGCG